MKQQTLPYVSLFLSVDITMVNVVCNIGFYEKKIKKQKPLSLVVIEKMT